MPINCESCVALLAPPYEISSYESSFQANWLRITDESLFRQISMDTSASFLGTFKGNYSSFEDYRRTFFEHYEGNITEEQALTKIRMGAPQNAVAFVECMRLCSDEDLSWTVTRENGQFVSVWMKWRPTPSAIGKLKSSTVVGAVSDQDGSSIGKVFPVGKTFDVNEEAEVVFKRDKTPTGYPAFMASVNVSGVARTVSLPETIKPRPVQEFRVRVKTGTKEHSGSDGKIFLHIGGEKYRLDRTDHDDFEAGATDEFRLPAWNGATDKDMRGMKAAIVNEDYAEAGQGWLCTDLYFAYRVGEVWFEHGPYHPGWLDEKYSPKVGRFDFVLSAR